jgi:hypothetical protein
VARVIPEVVMTKTRSPNYPSLSLPDAIEKAEAIYRKDFLNAMPPEVAAQHMGYSGLNGASLTTISALKKYGLLEGRGEALRLTKAAQGIIEKLPESDEMLNEMAFRPALWNEISGHFDGELPSEGNLRAFLLRKGFNPARVDVVIQNYIGTVEFVNRMPPSYTRPLDAGSMAKTTEVRPIMQAAANTQERSLPGHPAGQTMVFPMGKDFVATITFSGEITKKRLHKLMAHVELAADDYPDDTTQEPTEAL